MAMRKSFVDRTPRQLKSPPPQTTAGNKRSFDMRPKPSDLLRREDSRDRFIWRKEPALEQLLDEPIE